MSAAPPVSRQGAELYRRLIRYAAPHWPLFALATIGMVVVAASEAGFAALLKPMMDSNFVDRDPDVIRMIPFLMIGLFVVRGLASFVAEYGMTWVGRQVIQKLRREIFARLLYLPTDFFDRNAAGQLVSKLTFDVEQVAQATTNAITILIRDTLTVIFLLAYMFWISGWLSLLFIVVGPVIAVLVRFISGRFRRIGTRIQGSMGDVTQITEEIIDGQRIVKAFGGQEYEAGQFETINRNNFRLQMKRTVTSAASVPVVQLVAASALAVVIYLATRESMLETVSVGDFVSFIAAMLLLLPPLKRLTKVTQSVQTGIAAADSIFTLLDTDIETDRGRLSIEHARGEIEYRKLGFAYSADKGAVLSDIDLRVEPGQTIAFVGRSGSGKSTLVNLLARFYEPGQGAIFLDGHDVRDYRLKDLRAQIAMVGQEVILFNDTVARNIAYGFRDDASREDVRAAARAAHALDFIEQLPHGFDTLVGERGLLLSGGQRQRIAIARALLKDAPILILDEATSALDTESERAIQAALDTLMRDRTTLVIAHRLSTVEKADRILVLDQGRVVESGSHGELLARDGHYAALYRMQFHEPPPP